MRGFDVLHPIGFDAFGLPAENAAIKHNTQAAAWTYKNMDQALATMKRMGFSYDWIAWSRPAAPTTTAGASGSLRRCGKRAWSTEKNPVNWCPKCKTVLANEQVDRGQVLALRLRAREARPGAVVLQDHRVRSGAPRRPGEAPRLARARQADAGQLDRSLRGRRGRLHPLRQGRRAHRGRRGQDHRLHHACRYPVWRDLLPAPPE